MEIETLQEVKAELKRQLNANSRALDMWRAESSDRRWEIPSTIELTSYLVEKLDSTREALRQASDYAKRHASVLPGMTQEFIIKWRQIAS
jgi:hypothetical protein